MALGSLVVEVAANVARFSSDMGKIAQIAENEAKRIDRGLGVISNSLKALGTGFVVGLTLDTVKSKIEGVIASAAQIERVAQKTGATVEVLSGLASVAKLSNTSVDDLATGMQKLAKSAVDAQAGGEKSEAAFKAIGVGVTDLRGKRPDEIFELIARKLGEYQDGAEKVAVAQMLLGKSGANLLPVMKDVAEVGQLQAKVTADQTAMAEHYEQTTRKLEAAQNSVWKTISFQLLPVMDSFAGALLESATKADGVKGAIDGLAKDNSLREWAENAVMLAGYVVNAFDGIIRSAQLAGKAIGASIASISALGEGGGVFRKTGRDAFKEVWKGFGEEADTIANKTLFTDRLKSQFRLQDIVDKYGIGHTDQTSEDRRHGLGQQMIDASKLRDRVGAAAVPMDDPARKAMDGQIKLGEQMVAAVQKQYATSDGFVREFYQLQLITASDFYATQRQLIADELSGRMAALDIEEKGIRSYAATHKQLTEQQDAANRLSEVAQKRLAAQADATDKLKKAEFDQFKAKREFELATQAAARQWDLESDAMRFNIDMLGRSTLEVQKLTAARTIDLQVQQQIYAATQKGLSRQELADKIAELTTKAAVATASSTSLIEVAYNRQRDAIFGAHEALRKYMEDASNSGASVGALITDSLKGLEDLFVNLFTTGKLSWASLEQTILNGITRIIVQEQLIKPIAGYLQGGLSSGTGGGGLISGFLGMLGIGGGGGGDVVGATGDFARLDRLAYAGGFADGGYIPPGTWGWTGENGPEKIYGGQTGVTVQPSTSTPSSRTYQINVSMPQGATRDTGMQFGAQIARQLAVHDRRGN